MGGLKNLVLIGDKDPAVRDALQFVLRLEGFDVRAYADAFELLADSGLSDVICLVIGERMQSLNAFELLERLERQKIRSPTILLSNYMTPALRTRADAAGVRIVLEKPLLDNVLIESVRKIRADDR